MKLLDARHLFVDYGSFRAVDDLSFSIEAGTWLMIVGPNGAGKSTVLRALAQACNYRGDVILEGANARRMKAAERARFMGMLMQSHFVGYAFSVEEVVRLGRYAHASGFLTRRLNREKDDQAVFEALELTGMTEKRRQSVLTLSGGELQRTFLAQLLAQNPRLLLLDEPANHLDLIYQKQIFSLISDWICQEGRAVISVVHDLSLAKAFGTKAILMNKGKDIASGDVDEVLSPDHLDAVYGMDVGAWMRKMLDQWSQ
ncbi:MAG: ABC transporter ATP-binding protein [Clostridiaceae bacterium]|jgi:iron complex transport system ATP-binding protein|nr:ABC transporter ATP-binding protein [Clostridiaceae bacterium]